MEAKFEVNGEDVAQESATFLEAARRSASIWEDLPKHPGQYRVLTGPDRPFSFLLDLLIPRGDGPFPVVLTGDASTTAHDVTSAPEDRREDHRDQAGDARRRDADPRRDWPVLQHDLVITGADGDPPQRKVHGDNAGGAAVHGRRPLG